jgi:hypothetical protein
LVLSNNVEFTYSSHNSTSAFVVYVA